VLRSGAIHLTGLFVLSAHLTEDNAEALLSAARGQSRREIEKLLARWFPRPDTGSLIEPIMDFGSGSLGLTPTMSPSGVANAPRPATGPSTVDTCPGAGNSLGSAGARSKLEPLSASSYRIEFTASAELYAKLEQARELLSHTVPGGELATVFERALDALVEGEMRRRVGAGKPEQKRRRLKPGSRHVPREVARIVWERDGGQCTFVDGEGRRCSERRYLTLEHRHPWSLGGPATADNICLLCASHNANNARRVFGEKFLEKKRAERESSLEHDNSLESSPGHESSSEPTRSIDSPLFAGPTHSPKPAPSAGPKSFPEPAPSTDPNASTGTSLSAPLTNNVNPRSTPERGTVCQARNVYSESDGGGSAQRADVYGKLTTILCQFGFRKRQIVSALSELRARQAAPEIEPLLRAALAILVPA